MARRAAAPVIVATQTERQIIDTLLGVLPAAAASYEQCLADLGGPPRRSYRGTAHELREVLRETLHHFAPDRDVMAEAHFQLEVGQVRPTQRQRALYFFRMRRLSREERHAPELALEMVDEIAANMTRTAYERGAANAHGLTSAPDVRRMKMYIDAVLAELLEIHAQE